MKEKNTIKILFIIRVVLWVISLVATIYWMYWSSHLYTLGFYDEHEYAVAFRPIFARGLFTSLAAVAVSFVLRFISDGIKDKNKIKLIKESKVKP